MFSKIRDYVVWHGCFILICFFALPTVQSFALEPKPDGLIARWSGQVWGRLRVLPNIVRYGDQVHIHAVVVGGPASDPFWSCSQYVGWNPNGTSSISIDVPETWEMPYTAIDGGRKINSWAKAAGDPPPYGWENRISDTCYCEVTSWGAQGGCATREVRPSFFRMMDQFNPRAGNVQFAKVLSGSGWTMVGSVFGGYVGVSWGDWASGYVYVVSDENMLDEDSDNDGLSDAWEYAHSMNQSLDDFSGGDIQTMQSENRQMAETWIDPYAPGEPGWVSAGPNDWDGDGFSNKEEYLKWKSDVKDGSGFPFSPTYINSAARSFPFHLFLPALLQAVESSKQ